MMIAEQTATVEDLCDALTAKYPAGERAEYGWNMYRTWDGRFVVQLSVEGHPRENIDGTTIREALQKALAFRFMVRLRRCEDLMSESDFRVSKEGNRWAIYCRGSFALGLKSKKDALAHVQRCIENNRKRIEEWHRITEPITTSGVEGQDWCFV